VAGAGDGVYLNPMTLTDDETLTVEARLLQLLKHES